MLSTNSCGSKEDLKGITLHLASLASTSMQHHVQLYTVPGIYLRDLCMLGKSSPKWATCHGTDTSILWEEYCIKGEKVGTRKVAWWLRLFAALPEDQRSSLIPRIYTKWLTITCNSSSRVFKNLFCHLQTPTYTLYKPTYRGRYI